MDAFAFGYGPILDEEVDAPDIAADHDLCRALVAGKAGLHPDAWGNHDPLPLRWLLRRRPERELPGFGQPLLVEHRLDVWNEHKPQPKSKPRPKPAPRSAWPWEGPADSSPAGEVQLTCDDCEARFRVTMHYLRGQRPAVVHSIRLLGKDEGWTCIVGRDRCPKCSQLAPPQAKGNGAGAHQGDEQHR